MKTCSSPCTVTLDCVGAEEVEVQLAMVGLHEQGTGDHLMSELVSPNQPAGSFLVQCLHWHPLLGTTTKVEGTAQCAYTVWPHIT